MRDMSKTPVIITCENGMQDMFINYDRDVIEEDLEHMESRLGSPIVRYEYLSWVTKEVS